MINHVVAAVNLQCNQIYLYHFRLQSCMSLYTIHISTALSKFLKVQNLFILTYNYKNLCCVRSKQTNKHGFSNFAKYFANYSYFPLLMDPALSTDVHGFKTYLWTYRCVYC